MSHIEVTRKTQGEMLEAIKMLCGVIEGYPDVAAYPSIKACVQKASALIDQVDSEAKDVVDEGMHATAEQSYRRGYHQGYYQAMDEADDGVSFEVMEAFWDSTLRDWRYASCIDIVCPPELRR